MRKVYPQSRPWGTPVRWYEKTGEYRSPKAGEYYLSGAKPEAYMSHFDLSGKYYIVRECTPDTEIIVDGLKYRLVGPA